MTKTIIDRDADTASDAMPIAPVPAPTNGHEPSDETSDAVPAPLLRGQQRPSPIGPHLPNHPLAPLMGAFNTTVAQGFACFLSIKDNA